MHHPTDRIAHTTAFVIPDGNGIIDNNALYTGGTEWTFPVGVKYLQALHFTILAMPSTSSVTGSNRHSRPIPTNSIQLRFNVLIQSKLL